MRVLFFGMLGEFSRVPLAALLDANVTVCGVIVPGENLAGSVGDTLARCIDYGGFHVKARLKTSVSNSCLVDCIRVCPLGQSLECKASWYKFMNNIAILL